MELLLSSPMHWGTHELLIMTHLETEFRLFPPFTIFLDLFPCAGYFVNAFD